MKKDAKKGDKKPSNILQMLGLKKQEVAAKPTPAPTDAPPPQPKSARQPPQAFNVESMMNRYRHFEDIRKDALEFPDCRDQLLDAVIGSEQLFGRYITKMETLQALMEMRPNQKDYFIKLILTNPRSQIAFVQGFYTLHDTTEVLKEYKEKIMAYVFKDKGLRDHLICGLKSTQYGLKHFPEYKTQILDMIVNDSAKLIKCAGCSNDEFYAFCKAHPEYTNRLIEYIFTSDVVYRKMIDQGKDYFMSEFPEYADRLINFILSSEERFESEFPTFKDIYEFEKKYPQYEGKLINHALSTANYVRDEVTTATDITDLHEFNPAHAQTVLAMALADDAWVLKFLRIGDDLVNYLGSDLLRPIGNRCLELIYANRKKFATIIFNNTELNKIIVAAPKDHEAKLRLYYQLYTKELPLTEIIDKHCPDVATVQELQAYLASNITTMKPADILSLREHIASRLNTAEISAEMRTAFTELAGSLITPEKSDAQIKDKLKFLHSTSATSNPEPQQPHSPPKDQNFG